MCGTRDPNFIKHHALILQQVQQYVHDMTHSTESGALVVNCIPCGLSGQPQLRVEEIVRPNPTEAVSAFSNYHVEKGSTSKAKQSYVCTGGHAADFTVHHLIPIDSNATLANLFQITLHQGLRS